MKAARKKEDSFKEYGVRTLQLRYGIVITNYRHCRFVVARLETEGYPLIFLREWEENTDEGYIEWYSLYKSAMSAEEADEILDCLEAGNRRRANTFLKRYFKPEGMLCEFAGEMRLDDAVPDNWYEAWKAMEGPITFRRDYPGCYETDVEVEGYL